MTDTLIAAISRGDAEEIGAALQAQPLIDIDTLAKTLGLPLPNIRQAVAFLKIADGDKRVLFSFDEVYVLCSMIAAATRLQEERPTKEQVLQIIAEDGRFDLTTGVLGEELVKLKKPS